MAIDTANRRRNVMRIFTPMLLLNLVSADDLDEDDRENIAGAYIGFEYGPPAALANMGKSRLRIGVGVGIGV